MLPDDLFSSEPIYDVFVGGRSLPVKNELDYETGGFALQDPSRGLQCNIWRTRILNNKTEIVLDAQPRTAEGQHVAPETIITGANITEVSTSFDQNMRPVIAYVEDGTPKLYWYDTAIPGQTTTSYPGIITPRLSLDDKRALQSQISDVIFAYMREEGGENRLFYRQQRDRYTIEYDPTEDLDPSVRDEYRAMVAASPGLIKIGMNRQLRMQFMFRNPT